MFRATMCPSSGETTVFMLCLVLVILCGWLSGMQGGMSIIPHCIPDSHPHSDKYQVSNRYSYISWWWAHGRPKHVEKRNEHTKKNCAPSRLYLQDLLRCYVLSIGRRVFFRIKQSSKHWLLFNTLRTGLLNCLNARSRGFTFRHRASCI